MLRIAIVVLFFALAGAVWLTRSRSASTPNPAGIDAATPQRTEPARAGVPGSPDDEPRTGDGENDPITAGDTLSGEARSPDATPIVVPSTFDLAGFGIDQRGEPVTRFYIEAECLSATYERSTVASVSNVDGAFVLHGLTAGEWSIRAKGEAHAASRSVRARVPAALPVRLVMPLWARVSGHVRDAGGAPVGRASVKSGKRASWTLSDERGAFELADLDPGSVTLTADREGSCASLPLLLELAPGEQLAPVARYLPGQRATELGSVRHGSQSPRRAEHRDAQRDVAEHRYQITRVEIETEEGIGSPRPEPHYRLI